MLAGFDRAELEATTEKLLCAYWPLALVEREVISGRRSRRLAFTAMRKDPRRLPAVAEKDRRNQQA